VIALLTVASLVACTGGDPEAPANDSSVSSDSGAAGFDSAIVDSATMETSTEPEASTDAPSDVMDARTDADEATVVTETGGSCTEGGCPDGELCTFPDGSCGKSVGTCAKKPGKGDCAAMGTEPVCGCDGKDYSNHCFAALAGQSVAKIGSCTCGDGVCDIDAKEDCSTCPADCGACAGCGDGVCAKGTEDCTSCPDDCCTLTNCTLSTKCLGDMYCEFVPGTCGKSGTGLCQAPPSTCPAPTAGSDVCGCDGTSYASECVAAQAGVSVLHAGLCP
jgi:hypothetical protein